MIERINQKRQNEAGFTLVELLVVIVILGILASIVVFAVSGIANKGESAASKADISVVQAAQEAQYAQTKTGAKYISEAALVSGGFLREKSEKSDVCLKSDASDYEVVAAGTEKSPKGYTCVAF